MAYETELAERLRAALAAEPGVTEKKMFGGLAFLVRGNMAVAASGQGGLLVRGNPEDEAARLARPGATETIMRGRKMRGWIRVGTDHLATAKSLGEWVDVGVGYARSLPPK